MQARGQTTTWAPRLEAGVRVGNLDWLRRLRERFARRIPRKEHGIPATLHRCRATRPKPFRPPTAEAALDHMAAQGGQTWSITVYNALL